MGKQAFVLCLAAFGVILLIVAFVGKTPLSNFIDEQIKQKVELKPGSDSYKNWQESPVPIYDSFYLFNITNPSDFNNGGKARLGLVGPFVYRKIAIKKDANFSGDLDVAMYYDYTRYVFDNTETLKNNNITTLSDIVFIPNLPLITVASQIAHNSNLPPLVKTVLESLVETYEEQEGIDYLTLNATVEDVLWGMDDPIMAELYKFNLAPSPQLSLQTNGSADPAAETQPTLVYTGVTDISRVDEYLLYHGRNSSECWGSEAANRINGTEGSMFEPLLVYNKSRALTIYNEQLYRSVDLNYVGESHYAGIPCYQYKIPSWALENMDSNPVNEAYYAYIYSGMLNLTECASSVPLFVTKAMMLDADDRLSKNITLPTAPNRTLHDTYLCVEPYTGVVVDGHKRVQINIQIEHHDIVGILNNTQPAFIPLILVDEHGSITGDLADTLKNSLLIPVLISHVMFYVLIVVGAGVFFTGVTCHAVILRNKYRAAGSDELVSSQYEPDDYTQNLIQSDEGEERTPESSDQFLSFDGKTSRYFEASE